MRTPLHIWRTRIGMGVFILAVVEIPLHLAKYFRDRAIATSAKASRETIGADLRNAPAAPPGSVAVTWEELRAFGTSREPASSPLQKLVGQIITVTGFMVPLEDNLTSVTEFLLVPSPQACIHVPPPSSFQTIYVTMAAEKVAPHSLKAVAVTGKFFVLKSSFGTGAAAFTLEGFTVVPES